MLIETLGPAGTFGHQAAMLAIEQLRGEYGKDIRVHFLRTNADIPKAAAYRHHLGVVPIWNSAAGIVRGVTDFWLQRNEGIKVFVIGEVVLPIKHQLLVHPSVTKSRQIRGAMSHSHALGQCGVSLSRLKIGQRLEVNSTAEAARLVRHDRKHRRTAAIASQFAGDIYGLKLWRPNVQDSNENFTRFHILGPRPAAQTGNDRTALIFRVQGGSGNMMRVIQSIDFSDVVVSQVESIGPRSAPDSACYMEFDAHRNSIAGRIVLRHMQRAGDLKILGSFPRG